MFDAIAITFALLAVLTLVREYRRAGGITLLSLLTMGNLIYSALTPAISYYSPGSAVVFETYITQAGMVVDESGLTRLMMAAMLFQLACVAVSLGGAGRNVQRFPGEGAGAEFTSAAIRVGWVMLLLGLLGGVWLGLIYNGNFFGAYEVLYAERSSLFREHSTQAFLLLLGLYGASQLIAAYLMTRDIKMAALILLLVTLHGVGIKSKFPIFWVLLIFMVVAIGEGVRFFRLLLPAGLAVVVLLTMSVLRGIERLSDIPEYVERYQDELGGIAARFWENDIPGPASIAYYVINDLSAEYTLDPLLEIPKLLIPRFIYDRGVVVSDVWAAKMMGPLYEPGLGFGWSLLCDGYLILGWLGVMLVGYGVAKFARYLVDLRFVGSAKQVPLYRIMAYTASPIFLYGVRESAAGLVKTVLIMAALLWLPTFLWGIKKSISSCPKDIGSVQHGQ